MKFSSMGVLLISALMSGSSWPEPVTRHAVIVEPRQILSQPQPTPATDTWLTILLGGVLVALQLRRTQMDARRARVAN
jgi:hypothetical protein